MIKTDIPEIDAFIKAEIELIGGEENKEEQAQLWRMLYSGMRAILTAQLRLPAKDDDGADERVKRRIKIVKGYLEGRRGESSGQGS